jgi:hypothetical protein
MCILASQALRFWEPLYGVACLKRGTNHPRHALYMSLPERRHARLDYRLRRGHLRGRLRSPLRAVAGGGAPSETRSKAAQEAAAFQLEMNGRTEDLVTPTNCRGCMVRVAQHRSPMSAAKFREYAVEHLDWAKTATSDRERETFEQMARAWLEVAALWERVSRAEVGGPDRS